MAFSRTSSTKEFRVRCLTNSGKQIKDMDEDSCRKAIKQSIEDELSVRPTTAILALSIENGVELLTADWQRMTNFPLSEIAFCFVSKEFPNMFTFIARREDGIYCNIFKCWNEKEAKVLHKEMSITFRLASERAKHVNQLKQSRLNFYDGEISLLRRKTNGKPSVKYTCEMQNEDSEEEELMSFQ